MRYGQCGAPLILDISRRTADLRPASGPTAGRFAVKLIEVLEARGYMPAAAEEGIESGCTTLLASAIINRTIEALAERLALALIGALA